ncbi:hypothetical protein [Limosilactobacillus reuteri]|uniref:hypothetical protein n=1 Tax=Limosilactobacillus reuteri TaxID=1598 RepID=UPI001E2A96B1|nr:hypothetical protein [Limosilactobacillus reuteri]MCC4380217.1 hypothetical protein [Limosilactobacillus reuteri]
MNIENIELRWDLIGNRLKELNRSEILNLLNDYYNTDKKLKGIIKEYQLNLKPTQVVKAFPPFMTELKCPYDGARMLQKLPSRTFPEIMTRKEYCPKCGHKNMEMCRCDNCIEEEKSKRKKCRELIEQTYSQENHEKILLSLLSLKDRLYLSALLRAALSEDAKEIKPIKLKENKLAPTKEMEKDILNYLIDRQIIKVAPDSPLEAFPEDGPNYPNTYYIYKVNYLINVQDENLDHEELLKRLEYPSAEEFLSTPEECLTLWKEIAYQEVIEFLIYRMDAVGFKFSPGKKTRLVIGQLLENFSASQIWYFIYISVAYSYQWRRESGVSWKQGANSVITGIETRGQRAIAEEWEVKSFSRNFNLPASQLALVLYNSILQLGSNGYRKVPSKEIIQEKLEKL